MQHLLLEMRSFRVHVSVTITWVFNFESKSMTTWEAIFNSAWSAIYFPSFSNGFNHSNVAFPESNDLLVRFLFFMQLIVYLQKCHFFTHVKQSSTSRLRLMENIFLNFSKGSFWLKSSSHQQTTCNMLFVTCNFKSWLPKSNASVV